VEGGYIVHFKGPEGESSLQVGLVMMATGRKPRTQGLGLEVRSCPSHLPAALLRHLPASHRHPSCVSCSSC
jgi:hypothetical protein